MPDQARPAVRHRQGMVPRHMLHDEERSGLEVASVWLPRNLPEPGRSSPFNRPPRSLTPQPRGPALAPIRCTTTTPGTRPTAANPQLTPLAETARNRFTIHAECRRLAPALLLREGDRQRLADLARLPSVPSGLA